MKIIYSDTFTRAKLPAKTVLLASATITYSDTQTVDGFALLDCTGTVTVEASNDGFLTTLYSAVHTDSVIVDIGITISTATQWRVTADASGASFKLLYLGKFINIQNPSYQYGFLNTILATDRQTLGGVQFSKVHGRTRVGQWSFQNVSATNELNNWKNWFDSSNGFRQGFIIEEPLTSEVIIVKAPAGTFPLTYERPGLLSGSVNVQEML